MKWPVADKDFSSWGQWDSARSFLTEWALDGVSPGELDRIISNKTVGATLRASGDQFSFLWGILEATGLCAGGAEIPKGITSTQTRSSRALLIGLVAGRCHWRV